DRKGMTTSSDLPPAFAGPAAPRWLPRTLDDVKEAFSNGTLFENHWVEVKREVPNTAKGNKELARDLAAFANDSGCLVIGAEEDKATSTFTVQPVPLDGVPEKIDQVAGSN